MVIVPFDLLIEIVVSFLADRMMQPMLFAQDVVPNEPGLQSRLRSKLVAANFPYQILNRYFKIRLYTKQFNFKEPIYQVHQESERQSDLRDHLIQVLSLCEVVPVKYPFRQLVAVPLIQLYIGIDCK